MKQKLFFLLLVLVSFGILDSIAQEKKESFKPSVKINGRIQYDFEFLKREKGDISLNGNEFRRVHLSAAGKVAKNLKYKVETSFAHGAIGFRDVYLKYTAGKYGNFAVGSIAEPTGLDMATSSKYIPFFERAMLTSMQNFRWGAGFHYENYKLLDGKASLQMSYTNSGSHGDGFKDANLEDAMSFAVRATGVIFQDKEAHNLVHLGVNYDNRPYKDLKFRAENHMGGTDTGKYHYVFDGADNRSDLGLELGTTFGSISVQGEYKMQSLNAENKDYKMTSYYAFASYFLTGEHRPYKHASFGRVKPKNDIDNGGFGAVELLVRYSSMNASKDVMDLTRDEIDDSDPLNPITTSVFVNGAQPETIGNISIGLNWYLNAHARVMYNYVLTDDANESLGNLSGHLFRIQLDF